jgi:hypothetical protein
MKLFNITSKLIPCPLYRGQETSIHLQINFCHDFPTIFFYIWGEMIFDIKSERAEVLPITDIKLKDVGLENQEFALSIGEVCFNT